MDYILGLSGATLLFVVLIIGWALTLFGLPGNWLMVLAAAIYAYLVPDDWRMDISWTVVIVTIILAATGEIVELLAGTWTTHRAGGSRRAAVMALAGSMAGGVIGAVIGLPIPLVGSVLAVLLFAAGGAAIGAMLGESWKGRTMGTGWRVGKAAFWGRLLGTFGKVLAGSVILALTLLAILF